MMFKELGDALVHMAHLCGNDDEEPEDAAQIALKWNNCGQSVNTLVALYNSATITLGPDDPAEQHRWVKECQANGHHVFSSIKGICGLVEQRPLVFGEDDVVTSAVCDMAYRVYRKSDINKEALAKRIGVQYGVPWRGVFRLCRLLRLPVMSRSGNHYLPVYDGDSPLFELYGNDVAKMPFGDVTVYWPQGMTVSLPPDAYC